MSFVQLFLDPTSRISITSLVAGAGFAAIAYRIYILRDRPFRLGRFVRFLFPARVYRHPSFRVDVGILLLSRLFSPARLFAFGLTVAVAAAAFSALLGKMFGAFPAPLGVGLGTMLLLSGLLVLAYDFGTYITHRLSHRVPLLWAFHRVHHSAEELNPLTVLRKHPVYDLISLLLDALIVGPAQGMILYLWGPEATLTLVVYVNLGFGLFGFAASSLRHSHIWLSFGPVISRFLVSPAMHQIHHSRAERHWDRNYGEVFAMWDWMFGSLYLPREREALRFGLAGAEHDVHRSLADAMIEPFGFAFRVARETAMRGLGRIRPPAQPLSRRDG